MCELGSMFTCVIALIVTLGTYLVYTNHVKRRQWLILPIVALLYYGAGPVSLLFPLLMLFKALAGKDLHLAVMAFAGGLLWATLPAVWSMFVQYTPKELYMGIDYLKDSGRIFIDFLCLNGFDCGHRISVDASPHTWKYRGLGDFRMPFGSGFCWRVDLRGAELQPEP